MTTLVAGQYPSIFTDNTNPSQDGLVGDTIGTLKGTSTYTLKNIKEDHLISTTFSTKTFKLTVNGTGVCIRVTNPPPCGSRLCLELCLIGQATQTRTVNWGTDYTISTADSGFGTYVPSTKQVFTSWDGNPTIINTSISVANLKTGDAAYTAIYGLPPIICLKCLPPPCLFCAVAPVSASTVPTTSPTTSGTSP